MLFLRSPNDILQYNLSSGFRKPFRNPRRTDWIGYINTVEEKLRILRDRSIPSINDRIGYFSGILLHCCRDACPLSYLGEGSQTFWSNAEFQRRRCHTRKLFNKAKESNRDVDGSA